MRRNIDIHQFESFLKKDHMILTPGKRLAREIVEAWTTHRQTTESTPSRILVEPVDAWLERAWINAVEDGRLPLQRLLSNEQQAALWDDIIRKDVSRNHSFSLTQPRATAIRAKAAWDKLSMYRGSEISDLWGHFQFEEDCVVFARWARKFRDQMQKINGATRYQAYEQLLSLPAESTPTALYEFPELPPITRTALEHLSELAVITPKISSHHDTVPIVRRFATREDELAAAAEWAHSMSALPDKRTAIVLLDLERDRAQLEYFLRAQFDCLDAQYNDLPVNFSTGMPLGMTPMFRDAMIALQWEARPLPRSDWLALMRSPFFPGLLSNASQNELTVVERLFRSGITEISMDQTLHLLTRSASDTPLKAILIALRSDKSHRGKKTLSAWGQWIRSRLQIWRWPCRASLDSIEYQQLDRFDVSLDALGALSAVLPIQTHEAALTLWRQSLSNIAFQPKTPDDSIRVMGPLEAIGLEFEGMWICGAQQGVFPRVPRLDAFLPASIQKQFDFQELNGPRLLAHSQKLLEIWCAGSTETIVSYHELDRGLPRQPSALIAEFESTIQTGWFPPSRWLAHRQVEEMAVDERVPVAAQQSTGGSGLIRDQASCGFKAFIKHRIKVTLLGSEAFGFTAIERGLLLHEMMFYLWHDLSSQTALLDIAETALLERIERAAKTALNKLEADAERSGFSLRARVGESCWQLEQAFCIDVVTAWMNQERDRTIPFTVVSLEEESALNISGLELTLRPDRIDRLEDGRRIVIDYKSTAPAKSRWLGLRPQEPQLPLYTFLDQELEGIAFAPLTRDTQFIPLGNDLGLTQTPEKSLLQQTKGWAEDWDNLVAKWASALEELAKAFLAGVASIDPAPGACQHCDLKPVCRIEQIRRTQRSSAENEAFE